MGDLTGYDGTANSANQLQQAIWFIEQESLGASNTFVALATPAVGSGEWSGLGPVQVINLVYPDGRYAQDQLVLVPEPGILILLGLALSAVGLAARRYRLVP
jgi:PEP-CTERM motif